MEQSNFHNYQVLRMKDAPDIDVHLVPAAGDPAEGVGESGVPPLAPAVANAIFSATGKRVRRVPMGKSVEAKSKLPWIAPRNVALQFLNGLLLTRDHPFHQVANGD